MEVSCWSCKFYDIHLEHHFKTNPKEPCASCGLGEEDYDKYEERSEEEQKVPRCQSCNSKRLANISGHCNNTFHYDEDGFSHKGSVPYNINIGGGESIKIVFCTRCGQMQGKFPLKWND